VITIDGLPIEYGPVYIIEKLNFNIELFSEALFKSFDKAGEILKLPRFSENKEAYENYKKTILKQFKEQSFKQQMKNSTLFILEWEGHQIQFMPTVTTKRGNEGDEANYVKLLIFKRLKIQIARDVIDLIDAYNNK
jgi:hypothetical protein